MINRSFRRCVLVIIAITLALLATLTPPADANQPDPNREVGQVTEMDCPDGTPLHYVDDRLLSFGLTDDDVATVKAVLVDMGGNLLDVDQSHPYGVVSLHFDQLDPIDVRNELASKGIIVHLDHVFHFNPFWRFHPYEEPTATSAEAPTTEFGNLNRPVVVFDTGYPAGVALPTDYSLGEGSIAPVEDRSMTANHGPFIASQVAMWTLSDPTDITLQRVLVDTGFLAEAPPEEREHFDEIALIETMARADLDDNTVVNFSFGTYGCKRDYRPAALEAAMVSEHAERSVEFVTAAGNDETRARHYPSAFVRDYDWVISVGAHDGDPLRPPQPKRACFSNFGDITTWAPGMGVVGEIPTPDGPTLAQGSGTSFAASFVTAVMASKGETQIRDTSFGLHRIVADYHGRNSSSLPDDATACPPSDE